MQNRRGSRWKQRATAEGSDRQRRGGRLSRQPAETESRARRPHQARAAVTVASSQRRPAVFSKNGCCLQHNRHCTAMSRPSVHDDSETEDGAGRSAHASGSIAVKKKLKKKKSKKQILIFTNNHPLVRLMQPVYSLSLTTVARHSSRQLHLYFPRFTIYLIFCN